VVLADKDTYTCEVVNVEDEIMADNKMEQVAAIFGKELDEQFYIVIHKKKYIARFTVFGLSVLDESANPCEWDLGHSRLLECLFTGEAVITNE
jgi:hypothetical protein